MSLILGMYCLVKDHPEEGTETIESYDSLDKAVEALKFIREHKYHVAEYDEIKVKTYYEDEEFTFFVDREVYNSQGTVIDFIGVDYA